MVAKAMTNLPWFKGEYPPSLTHRRVLCQKGLARPQDPTSIASGIRKIFAGSTVVGYNDAVRGGDPVSIGYVETSCGVSWLICRPRKKQIKQQLLNRSSQWLPNKWSPIPLAFA
jgi:hypothetical protein